MSHRDTYTEKETRAENIIFRFKKIIINCVKALNSVQILRDRRNVWGQGIVPRGGLLSACLICRRKNFFREAPIAFLCMKRTSRPRSSKSLGERFIMSSDSFRFLFPEITRHTFLLSFSRLLSFFAGIFDH